MTTHFDTTDIYAIVVRFKCPYCQQEVSSGEFPIQGANYAADDSAKSYICEDYEATCDNCEQTYYFSVCAGVSDGYVEFDETEDISSPRIDVISNDEYTQYYKEQFDAIADNTHLFQTFRYSIKNLKSLNSITLDGTELNSILKRQIYTGVIATMETFLSDSMINLTLSDKKFIRNFVENYPEFTKQKFDLRQIFAEYEKIQETIKVILLDTIYHDLRKVREMYRSTFRIDFPDISEPAKCVLKRHDIVHRNGKSKDGVLLNIDTAEVSEAIHIIDSFVTGIAQRLKII